MDPSQLASAREIVISAHEAAHAVASVRLGLPFSYVTFGDENGDGPRVESIDNLPRPIFFYRGGGPCCGGNAPMCAACSTEKERAEAWMIMAMCGSLGSAATGDNLFGYGHDADRAYVVAFCREAFGDFADAAVNARIEDILDRALALMKLEGKTASAVARALRERRTLTEDDVRQVMLTAQ